MSNDTERNTSSGAGGRLRESLNGISTLRPAAGSVESPSGGQDIIQKSLTGISELRPAAPASPAASTGSTGGGNQGSGKTQGGSGKSR